MYKMAVFVGGRPVGDHVLVAARVIQCASSKVLVGSSHGVWNSLFDDESPDNFCNSRWQSDDVTHFTSSPFFNSLIQILPSLFLGGQEKRVQRREMPWRSEYLQVCGVNPICAMNDTETKTWQMCSLLESEIVEAVGWSQEDVSLLSRPIFECGHLELVLRLLAFEAVKDFFMALFAVRSH